MTSSKFDFKPLANNFEFSSLASSPHNCGIYLKSVTCHQTVKNGVVGDHDKRLAKIMVDAVQNTPIFID